MSAPSDVVDEHRRAYPERACELRGRACNGIVTVTYGAHQLCTGHAAAFIDMVYATMPKRIEGWIAKMKQPDAGHRGPS